MTDFDQQTQIIWKFFHEMAELAQSDSMKNVVGMSLCGLAAMFFSLTVVIVKFTTWPRAILLEARSLIQMIFCLVLFAIFKSRGKDIELLGPRETRGYLVARSVVYWAFILLYWTALIFLDVGDATALVYSSPIFAGLIGFVWLGEPFHYTYVIFTGLNIAGMILVSRPSFLFASEHSISTVGLFFALLSAAFGGLLGPLVRKSKSAHWTSVELYAHVGSALFLTPVLLCGQSLLYGYENVVPDGPIPWLAILGISASGFSGLACYTIGYQYAHASVGSLLMYLEIPISYIFQVTLFGQPVDWPAIAGCALIMASGLSSFIRHFRLGVQTIGDDDPGESTPLLINTPPMSKPIENGIMDCV